MAAIDVPMQAFGANAEINALIEFDSIASDATISATTPISGTYSYLLDYSKDGNNDLLCGMTWNTVAYDGLIIHTLIKVASTPAAIVFLVQGFGLQIELNTSRQLVLNQLVTGSVALALDTVYRIEAVSDGDTFKYGLRLYNSSGTLLETLTSSTPNFGVANTTIIFGWTNKDYTSTNPACAVRLDEIAAWARKSNSGVNLFWPGATFVNHDTVDAAGTYNDYTGVGDVTNKWDNVNEWDGDTTYNQGGLLNTTKQQSHAVKDVTVLSGAQVMKGAMVGGLFKSSISASAIAPQTANMLVRESSVDYTAAAAVGSFLGYGIRLMGFYKMPSGVNMTEATVNALEVGSENRGTNISTYGASGQVSPTGDDATDDTWTVSSGSANAFSVVDEDVSSPNNADYISTATAAAKQGFSFPAYTVPSGTYIGGMAVGVTFGTSLILNASTAKLFYKDPGGTYRYEDNISESITSFQLFTFVWSTNPYTGTDWVTGDINAANARFGIEKVNTVDGKASALQVRPLLISQYRESYYFVNRIYGDVPVEIYRVGHKGVQANQAVNRAATY